MTLSPMRNALAGAFPAERETRGRLGAVGLMMVGALLLTSACQSIHKSVSDRFTLMRQDALVRNLEQARLAHLDGFDQFSVALDSFIAMIEQDEIPVRERYENLSREFARTEAAVDEIHEQVNRLEQAARNYFMDWEKRLYEYRDPVIRNASREQLNSTRQQYENSIARVRRTEERARLVMEAFNDQMLFLRHNLNQQALSALEKPGFELRLEIEDLLEELKQVSESLATVAQNLRVE